eukprot:4462834-Prymnesium_polylepis.1
MRPPARVGHMASASHRPCRISDSASACRRCTHVTTIVSLSLRVPTGHRAWRRLGSGARSLNRSRWRWKGRKMR